jgi:DNA-binding NarL/FixJ family response regulator
MPIRLVIVDDQPLMHDAIQTALASVPDFALVGQGYCGADFARLVAALQPAVVLLDLSMPQTLAEDAFDRFEPAPALAWCKAHYPQTRIVILSQHLDFVLLQEGVAGYWHKNDINAEDLAQLFRSLAAGKVTTSKRVMARLHARPLTERQIEVLRQVAQHPNRAYAEHAVTLGIAEVTFKKNLNEAYRRLGVKNITAAILAAQWAGYIPFAPPSPD